MNEPILPQGSAVLRHQKPLLLHLLNAAYCQAPPDPASPLATRVPQVLNGGRFESFLHDGVVLDALCAEAEAHLQARRHAEALAWGKAAYVATRRFVHSWLRFLDIAIATNALPSYDPPDGPAVLGQSDKIPRQIVQFWDDPNVPPDVAALIAGWKTRAGDFAHRLFHDAEAHQFISEQYGEAALRIYASCEHAAGKSDLFRLAWLARHGGIYIDADDACIGDLNLLLPPSAGLVVNWSGGPPPCVNNWFVAARPGHPIIQNMWQQALYNLPEATARGLRLSPWVTTGPGLYSMALMDEIALSHPQPPQLADLSFQTEAFYRQAISSVGDLEYRATDKGNWKRVYK